MASIFSVSPVTSSTTVLAPTSMIFALKICAICITSVRMIPDSALTLMSAISLAT